MISKQIAANNAKANTKATAKTEAARVRRPSSASERWMARYAALVVVLGSLTLIFVATLHPFNFVWENPLTWQQVVERLDMQILRADSWIDIPRNVLLFMPFGIGLYALLRTWKFSTRTRFLCAGLAGFFITVLVEGLQFSLPLRSPELSDVLANTTGMLAGVLTYQRWLAKESPHALIHRFRMRRHAFWVLVSIVILGLLLSFGLFRNAQRNAKLSNWDSSYRLAIGNEVTNDRPWRGHVDEVIILDRGATRSDVEAFLQGTQFPAAGSAGTIAHYCLVCAEKLHDLAGFSPDLETKTFYVGDDLIEAGLAEAEMLRTGIPDTLTWLQTTTPATGLSTRIAATSEFSVLAAIHPGAREQSGPARILTLSKDANNRNLTIGQDGDDLVVRVRTLGTGRNGLRPEFRIPAVLRDTSPHRIAVTYSSSNGSSTLRVYVDSVDNTFSARLTPEIAVVSKLIPLNNWHVAMSASSLAVYSGIYYLLLLESVLLLGLIPLAWAMGAVAMGWRPSSLR